MAAEFFSLQSIDLLLKWGKKPFAWIFQKWADLAWPPVPRETVRVVPGEHLAWYLVGPENAQKMRVYAIWHITNITTEPIIVLKAQLFGWGRRPLAEDSVNTPHQTKPQFNR